MAIEGGCSNCDFSRRFSEELAGRFYRCPRCRNGVIAVPQCEPSESDAFPIQLSSDSFEFPLAIERRRMLERRDKETEENTALDKTAIEDQPFDEKKTFQDRVSKTSVDEARQVPPRPNDPSSEAEPLSSSAIDALGTDHRGETAPARRLLVECALCGFHVRVPVELFGKTIHCPECAGDTVFSESTLEPVKDELLDRLAMETTERRALFGGKGNMSLKDRLRSLLQGNAVKSFLVGVGLGLLVLLALYGVWEARLSSDRDTAVERALDQGWRYASNGGSKAFHEPWCRSLDPQNPGERVTSDELDAMEDAERHACE